MKAWKVGQDVGNAKSQEANSKVVQMVMKQKAA
jgi:hypothetical protein